LSHLLKVEHCESKGTAGKTKNLKVDDH